MDRQDFMGLIESYMSVYEQDEYFEEDVEEIDEARAEENLSPTEKEVIRNKRAFSGNPFSSNATSKRSERRPATSLRRGFHDVKRGVKRIEKGSKENYDRTPVGQYDNKNDRADRIKVLKTMAQNRARGISRNESYDLYDLVLEYLLDEGLCESVENAEIMMAHMSEGWVDAIVEGFKPTQYSTSGNIFTSRGKKAQQIDRQISNLKSKGKGDQANVVDFLNRHMDHPKGRADSREQSTRNKAKLDTRARRDAQRDEKESRKGR